MVGIGPGSGSIGYLYPIILDPILIPAQPDLVVQSQGCLSVFVSVPVPVSVLFCPVSFLSMQVESAKPTGASCEAPFVITGRQSVSALVPYHSHDTYFSPHLPLQLFSDLPHLLSSLLSSLPLPRTSSLPYSPLFCLVLCSLHRTCDSSP